MCFYAVCFIASIVENANCKIQPKWLFMPVYRTLSAVDSFVHVLYVFWSAH